jgi:hypothetical protein
MVTEQRKGQSMPTKQQTPSKPPADPVADAQAVLTNLEVQREELVRARAADDAEMSRVSFAAHASRELSAIEALRAIGERGRERDQRLRELDCAILESRSRLAAAQAAEVAAVNRQRAAEARELVRELGECFPYVDKHLEAAANGLIAINDGIQKLHELGFASPTDNQARLNICAIIETWAMRLPKHFHNQLRDGVRFLAPHERKTGVQYWTAIELSLQNQIAQHLGKPESARVKEEAA